MDKMGVKIGASPADATSTISDAIRYTFCFSQDNYLLGWNYVQERLESAGYRMAYSKNRWLDDPQYKGVNSRWETAEGARFELQFHTPESFYAKHEVTHESYGRLRSHETSWDELIELEVYQRTVSGAVPVPVGVDKNSGLPEGSR